MDKTVFDALVYSMALDLADAFRLAIYAHLRSLEVQVEGDSAKAYVRAIVKAAGYLVEEVQDVDATDNLYVIGEAHLLAMLADKEGE